MDEKFIIAIVVGALYFIMFMIAVVTYFYNKNMERRRLDDIVEYNKKRESIRKASDYAVYDEKAGFPVL